MKRLMSNSSQLAKGRLVSGRPMFFSCSRCTSNRISEGMICLGADAPERDEPLRGRVSIAVSRPWEARVVSVIIAYRGLWRTPNGTAATDPKSAIALCVGKTLKEIGGNWWTVNETETKTGVMLDCYLTTTALTILKPTREKGSVFALPSDPSKAFPDHRLLKYVKRQHEYFGLAPWQPRDLRRTFTPLAKGLGYDDQIVNRAQARKDSSVIRVHYDKRRYYDELRQLFEAVEREILRINGQPVENAKAIQLR